MTVHCLQRTASLFERGDRTDIMVSPHSPHRSFRVQPLILQNDKSISAAHAEPRLSPLEALHGFYTQKPPMTVSKPINSPWATLNKPISGGHFWEAREPGAPQLLKPTSIFPLFLALESGICFSEGKFRLRCHSFRG